MTILADTTVAAVRQSGQWQCSAASTAWLLDALGESTTQDDVVNNLGPGRIDPSVGLHDHTGSGLVAMLGDVPYQVAAANGRVSFEDALALASGEPFVLGGDKWDHWTGVRGADGDVLLLANPSPGWMGVGDRLGRDDFARLGPFYAVWPIDAVAAAPTPPAAAPTVAAPSVAAAPPAAPPEVPSSSPPVWALVAGGVAVAWALDLL